ncbi:hypothetical protein PFISCL1PPCAC_19376, partial [Pristionchus fissidentatus]
ISSSPPLTDSRAESGNGANTVLTCAAEACGKSFISIGSLCWHMQESHPEDQLIECEKCTAPFATRDQYSAHECFVEVAPRSSSACIVRDTVEEAEQRRSVPARIRTDFRILDNGEPMDYEEESSREATEEPSQSKGINLFSALFPKNDNGPIDLSSASPSSDLLSLPHLPSHPAFMHQQQQHFMVRPPQEMMMTPTGRVPVDSILQNEDDWESLMEISNTDEAEKVRALVGDNPIPTTDPNQCILCRRVLSCKSALQMHYRTHTGERPFKCKICQRAFTTKGNLKTHMGVHRAKHPFRPNMQMGGGGMMPPGNLPQQQCPICQKRFVTVPQLQSHIAEHTQRLIPPLCPPLPPPSSSSSSLPPQSIDNPSPHPPPSLPSLPPFPTGLPFLPFMAPPSAAAAAAAAGAAQNGQVLCLTHLTYRNPLPLAVRVVHAAVAAGTATNGGRGRSC